MLVRGSLLPQQLTVHGDKFPNILKRRYVSRGIIPRVMQIATSVSPGPVDTADPEHIHKTGVEWYFVLAGCAMFRVGNENHNVEPGDMIVVQPNTTHSYVVADGEVLHLLYGLNATDE